MGFGNLEERGGGVFLAALVDKVLRATELSVYLLY